MDQYKGDLEREGSQMKDDNMQRIGDTKRSAGFLFFSKISENN